MYNNDISMSDRQKLKNHIQNFTVKQLKKEILKVKKEFQVSKMNRNQVEAVILLQSHHFKYLLNKKGDKKSESENCEKNSQET